MPLAFRSTSHGTIAFGFFNIETDCLLLDRSLFFCPDFCAAAIALGEAQGPVETVIAGYRAADAAAMGDLMEAIHGRCLDPDRDLFAAVYARWPFPAEPDRFRQNPRGEDNRALAEAIVARFAAPDRIVITRAGGTGEPVRIGEYLFDEAGFAELAAYVWRGGYPTWGDGGRPGCVSALGRAWRLDRSDGEGGG